MPPKKQEKRPPNWSKLYDQLRSVLAESGNARKLAALDNHSDRKETFCRKMGVVCSADVGRIERKLKA